MAPCIGATTIDEYRRQIEKDAALERRFRPVKIREPTVDATVGILKGFRERYEGHHKVQYTDAALVAAAELSHKHISDCFLPDKAIDLMDEAGSFVSLRIAQCKPSKKVNDMEAELKKILKEKNDAVRIQNFRRAKLLRDHELELRSQISVLSDKKKQMMRSCSNKADLGTSAMPVVTEEDIERTVSGWTGVPVQKVSMDESTKLLKMEETLHRRVVGQDEAVTSISRANRRARLGLKDPGRPVASLVFAGQLTEAVRRRPHTVVLFDEVEKAHRDMFDLMLQVFDDGRLTDEKGRTVDFKNTLIIMTSNLGSSVVKNGGHGLDGGGGASKIKNMVFDEMKRHFRPEFLNRLDDAIIFQPLTKLDVGKIAGIMMEDFAGRMRKKGIKLHVTEKFKELVFEEGFDPSYGARPLRRAVVRLLEDILTDKMLAGELREGDSVIVDADSAGNAVVSRSNAMPERGVL